MKPQVISTCEFDSEFYVVSSLFLQKVRDAVEAQSGPFRPVGS
jgi:hypothetical protein